jgi:Raf kinase inhibitor-like YbhB/YbcL family protein
MEPNKFFIDSPAFRYGDEMPIDYTALGRNVSPPLEWSQVPPETKCYALVCEDPDAPNAPFIHWVIYNIPGSIVELRENIPAKDILSTGASQGVNSRGELGYYGPNPPPGTGTHRYYFRLFALDKEMDLQPGLTATQVLDEIRFQIIGEAEFLGRNQSLH